VKLLLQMLFPFYTTFQNILSFCVKFPAPSVKKCL